MSEFAFGRRSREHLNTCHPHLIAVMEAAIKHTPIDFTVLEGHRSTERQRRMFEEGRSTLDGVRNLSKHQSTPSIAVDVAPYPIDWDSPVAVKRFFWLSGVIFAHASMLSVKIRWGGNWNGRDIVDGEQRFHDLPHFELME